MSGLTSGLAILLPQVQLVFGLLGSTTSVALMFIFPGCMLVSYSNSESLCVQQEASSGLLSALWQSDKLRGWVIIILGGFIGISGTAVNIYQDIV